VHDHVLLRQGLKRLLDDEPDMQVVAEAGNVAEALQKAFEHRPEVGITDAHMFESAADRTEGLILRESPYSKVLFLTAHNSEDTAPSETNSFAVRHTSAEELVEMVRRTHTSQRMVLLSGNAAPMLQSASWCCKSLIVGWYSAAAAPL